MAGLTLKGVVAESTQKTCRSHIRPKRRSTKRNLDLIVSNGYFFCEQLSEQQMNFFVQFSRRTVQTVRHVEPGLWDEPFHRVRNQCDWDGELIVCMFDSVNLKLLCDACLQAGPDSVPVGFVRSTVHSVMCDLITFS